MQSWLRSAPATHHSRPEASRDTVQIECPPPAVPWLLHRYRERPIRALCTLAASHPPHVSLAASCRSHRKPVRSGLRSRASDPIGRDKTVWLFLDPEWQRTPPPLPVQALPRLLARPALPR